MILAAGRGERMRPLTDVQPKPLLCVGGKPLIEYHIEKLVAAGVTDIVVNAAWLTEQLASFVGDGSRFGACIQLSPETTALETAGGIRQALPLLGPEPFIVVNGDVWTDYDVKRLLGDDYRGRLAHLVLVANPPHHRAGDFALNSSGRLDLQAIPRYTYSGLGVFSPQLFAGLPKGPAALAPLLRAQLARVSGEVYCGAWFDVGTPERLAEVDNHLTRETSQEPVL
jgi:MurNAc alpha-1-phosphate uridylyltransferase